MKVPVNSQSEKQFNISYALAVDDIDECLRFIRTRPKQKFYYYFLWAMIPGAILIPLLLPAPTGTKVRTFEEMATAVFPWAIGWLIAYPFIRVFGNRRELSRLVNALPNDYLGTHEVLITQAGISDKTRDAETSFKWASFTAITNTASHVFLYQKDKITLIIPKSGFQDQREFDAFLQFAKSFICTNG